MNVQVDDLRKELHYKTSRSGGKGGQHVNKVSSKVELIFDFAASALFNEDEKALLSSRLGRYLNKDGAVHVTCEEERSQYLNKEKAIQKLVQVLQRALHREKPRKATRPTRSSVEKRLSEKKQQSERKQNRRPDY
jgi:ribosome-associated protein